MNPKPGDVKPAVGQCSVLNDWKRERTFVLYRANPPVLSGFSLHPTKPFAQRLS